MRRARIWQFAVATGGRLLSWMIVAVILTAFTYWDRHRNAAATGSTTVTGAERPATLARLDDAASESADLSEQSNKQNFALAYDVEEAKVDYEIFLNPDCTAKTNFYLYVREKPAHGTVRIDPDRNYTGYDPDTQRYKCNVLPIQSPSIFYRRNKGFVGQDHFSVEVFEPGGFVRSTRYLIDAR